MGDVTSVPTFSTRPHLKSVKIMTCSKLDHFDETDGPAKGQETQTIFG